MLTLHCRACGKSLHSQEYIDHLHDWEDLCYQCLAEIGILKIEDEAKIFLEESYDLHTTGDKNDII